MQGLNLEDVGLGCIVKSVHCEECACMGTRLSVN